MSQDSAFKKTEIFLMGALALVAMALVTIAVVPGLRTKIKDHFTSKERQILAKISGSIAEVGPNITVLKIKTGMEISLEIYEKAAEGELTLIAKIPLFETRDGHFLLQGNATNLALTDVDNDEQLEIVAPTYDDQMVPRLNIFKYNSESKSFDRVSAPSDF